MKFFTEPALSQKSRFFASLRMTGEGFRMTTIVFPLLRHSLQGRGGFYGVFHKNVRRKFSDLNMVESNTLDRIRNFNYKSVILILE
jgi:hypothetical protein